MRPLLAAPEIDITAPVPALPVPHVRRVPAIADLLRQVTIRARLFAAFALMCVLLAALGAVAWWATSMQNKAFNLFVSGAVTSVRQGGDMRSAFVETRVREKEFLLSAGNAQRQAEALRGWREEVAQVDRAFASLETQLRHPGALAKLKEIRAAFAAYARQMETVFAAVENGGDASAEPASTAGRAADADYRRAQAAMQDAFALFDDVLREVVKKINGLADMLAKAVWVALAVAVALAAAAVWAIVRSIDRPLRQAEAFAGRLQEGDLTAGMEVRGRDEITRLASALAAMQHGLRGIVAQARVAAGTVATSSAQIAGGSADLSQRTDEQAASLEETAASLEELASTVQQNANTAQAVRQVSVQAAEAATRSSAVVEQVAGAMERITASSRRIGDIIGVIDNIAFRTNILALNAAVESARAGAQGRGFAVVAGEVRSLAQRSAEAAREIRGLIADTGGTVESGNALAADAGHALAALLAQVRQVDGLVAQITAASIEQSTGLGQVTDAVAQLDRVTQQNAALVEESAAAAASLNQQAVEMAGAVARFRLE